MYYEVKEWINIALLCEKLHVLPNEGGLFDQGEQAVNRLLAIYRHLDEWREQEMKKSSSSNSNDK